MFHCRPLPLSRCPRRTIGDHTAPMTAWIALSRCETLASERDKCQGFLIANESRLSCFESLLYDPAASTMTAIVICRRTRILSGGFGGAPAIHRESFSAIDSVGLGCHPGGVFCHDDCAGRPGHGDAGCGGRRASFP